MCFISFTDLIRKAKQDYYEYKCEEIEDLQVKLEEINELFGTGKRKQLNMLYHKGKSVTEIEQKLKVW